MILFISDLDNTLIYSYKHYDQGICVETKEGKALSYMTPESYHLLQQIAERCLFVPLTTRSLEQYRRIRLLQKGSPTYAITGNGTTLLVNGTVDQLWQMETQVLIADSLEEMAKGKEKLDHDANVTLAARLVDGAFVYGKSAMVEETLHMLAQHLDLSKVTLAHHKEKFYILPNRLTKGEAVRRLKHRLAKDWVIAAGDSYFDHSMLIEADIAMIPQNSELEPLLLTHPCCKSSGLPGVGFAEEVLNNVLHQLTQ